MARSTSPASSARPASANLRSASSDDVVTASSGCPARTSRSDSPAFSRMSWESRSMAGRRSSVSAARLAERRHGVAVVGDGCAP